MSARQENEKPDKFACPEGALWCIIPKRDKDYNLFTIWIERPKSFSKEFSSLVLCVPYSDSPKYEEDTYQITI